MIKPGKKQLRQKEQDAGGLKEPQAGHLAGQKTNPAPDGKAKPAAQRTKLPLSPEEKKRRRSREEVKSFFLRMAVLLLFLWLIFGVCFGIAPVRNGDMFPRISAGDLMLYYRLERNYNSQDVIVYEKDEQSRVGRVIAHGGDTVEITGEGEIKINGSIVMENNVFYDTYPYEGGTVTYPLTLAEDEVFVLGDNRQGAKDSRYYGAIQTDEIKGKVITILRRSDL